MRPSSFKLYKSKQHMALNRSAPICSIPLHGPNTRVSLGQICNYCNPWFSHCLAVKSVSGRRGWCSGLQTTRQPSSTRPMSLQHEAKQKFWSQFTLSISLTHAMTCYDIKQRPCLCDSIISWTLDEFQEIAALPVLLVQVSGLMAVRAMRICNTLQHHVTSLLLASVRGS